MSEEHGAGDGLQEGARLFRDHVAAQDEHTSACLAVRRPGARLARTHQGLQCRLEILYVGGGALVQDHEVDRELFHAPVLMSTEQLPDDLEIPVLVDSHENDR